MTTMITEVAIEEVSLLTNDAEPAVPRAHVLAVKAVEVPPAPIPPPVIVQPAPVMTTMSAAEFASQMIEATHAPRGTGMAAMRKLRAMHPDAFKAYQAASVEPAAEPAEHTAEPATKARQDFNTLVEKIATARGVRSAIAMSMAREHRAEFEAAFGG